MLETTERYFPNHVLERDIGLAEYTVAAQRLNNQERSITWSTSTLSIVAALLSFSAFKLTDFKATIEINGMNESHIHLFGLLTIMMVSFFSIVHISKLLQSQVFAERKIVVLRRMLGVSYGRNTLVLPNWRVEGADDPFSIRMFPGFFSYKFFPVLMILLAGSVSIYLLFGSILKNANLNEEIFGQSSFRASIALIVIWNLIGIATFRWLLRDHNENTWLWIARLIAAMARIQLVPNFEQTLYRVKLEVAESTRLKTDFGHAKKFAIHIEDELFLQHSGINWRGTLAAFISMFRKKSRGGSSITQQFCRSNFIERPSMSIRRKLVEMLLAKWIESVWSKDDILLSYLSTVRFERRIYGLVRAYKHFFEDSADQIQPWEAFILIERLGNIRGKFLGGRVKKLLEKCMFADILSFEEARRALEYYETMLGLHFQPMEDDLTPNDVLGRLSEKRGSATTPH